MIKVDFQVKKGRNLYYTSENKQQVKIAQLEKGEQLPYIWAEGHGILISLNRNKLFLTLIKENFRTLHWQLKNLGLEGQEIQQIFLISDNRFFLYPRVKFVDGILDKNERAYTSIRDFLCKGNYSELKASILEYSLNETTYEEKFQWVEASKASEEYELSLPPSQRFIAFMSAADHYKRRICDRVMVLEIPIGGRPTKLQRGECNKYIREKALNLARHADKPGRKTEYLEISLERINTSEPIYFLMELLLESFHPEGCKNFNQSLCNWIGSHWSALEESKVNIFILSQKILEGQPPAAGMPEHLKKHYKACVKYLLDQIMSNKANIFACLEMVVNHAEKLLNESSDVNYNPFIGNLIRRLFKLSYRELVAMGADCAAELRQKILYTLPPHNLKPGKSKDNFKGLADFLGFLEQVVAFRRGDFSQMDELLDQFMEFEPNNTSIELYNDLVMFIPEKDLPKVEQKWETEIGGEKYGASFYSCKPGYQFYNYSKDASIIFSDPRRIHRIINLLSNDLKRVLSVCRHSEVMAIIPQLKKELLLLKKNKRPRQCKEALQELEFCEARKKVGSQRGLKKKIYRACILFKSRLSPFNSMAAEFKNKLMGISINLLDFFSK
ncbi:hypothetical protein ACFL35_04225 [Candidatus Riflebacteria bacterium]